MENIAIIISAIIALLAIGVNIFINAKLRFATSEEEAMDHTKILLLNLGFVLISCFNVYILFDEFSSPLPLDKKSLFVIIILSFSQFILFLFWLLWPIGRIISNLVKIAQIRCSTISPPNEKHE